MKKYSIAIHGGAGTLVRGMMTAEKEEAYKRALELSLHAGYDVLEKGGTAIEAVEQAVTHLEDSPLFNAGRGSVFTAKAITKWTPLLWMAQTKVQVRSL